MYEDSSDGKAHDFGERFFKRLNIAPLYRESVMVVCYCYHQGILLMPYHGSFFV